MFESKGQSKRISLIQHGNNQNQVNISDIANQTFQFFQINVFHHHILLLWKCEVYAVGWGWGTQV